MNGPGIPAAAAVGGETLAADRPAGKEGLALADHFGVYLFQRADLGGGEAIGTVGSGFAVRQVAGGLEVALARIVDDAVLDAVHGVALSVDAGGERGQFGGADRRCFERLGRLHEMEHGAGEVEHRRAHRDAVEIVWETLRENQRLAPAGRAAFEVALGGRPP